MVEGESERISKSAALFRIRHLLADWVERNVSIKMRDVRQIPIGASITRRAKPSPYIPDKLPAAEIPGLKFVGPKSKPTAAYIAWLNSRIWQSIKSF